MSELKKVDLESIAERLKLIRGKFSRDKFSSMLGIHRNTLANYENAQRTLGADALIGMTDIGINPMWVLKGEGDILLPEAELSAELLKNEVKLEFYKGFRSHLLESPKYPDYAEKHFNSDSYIKRDRNKKSGISDPTLHKEVGSEAKLKYEYSPWSEPKDLVEEIFDPASGSGGLPSESIKRLDNQKYVALPFFDISAIGGIGQHVKNGPGFEGLLFRRDWIENSLQNVPGNLSVFYINDDGMESYLRPGDLVIIDHSDQVPKTDGIYVIRMAKTSMVKRLQRIPGHKIKVISENTVYESFEYSTEWNISSEFGIIGKVVWSGRRH